MATLANIAIAGAGLTTAGGLVGGGYFVFKDEPREMSHFMKNVTKRELLEEGKDEDGWKQAWKNYINANSKTEIVDEAPEPVPPKKVSRTTVLDEDIWKLGDWKQHKDNSDKVPPSFKKKCAEKHTQEKPVGVWSKAYKDFEKFCTKPAPSDD